MTYCEHCGNKSGKADARGQCASCGAPLVSYRESYHTITLSTLSTDARVYPSIMSTYDMSQAITSRYEMEFLGRTK